MSIVNINKLNQLLMPRNQGGLYFLRLQTELCQIQESLIGDALNL